MIETMLFPSDMAERPSHCTAGLVCLPSGKFTYKWGLTNEAVLRIAPSAGKLNINFVVTCEPLIGLHMTILGLLILAVDLILSNTPSK